MERKRQEAAESERKRQEAAESERKRQEAAEAEKIVAEEEARRLSMQRQTSEAGMKRSFSPTRHSNPSRMDLSPLSFQLKIAQEEEEQLKREVATAAKKQKLEELQRKNEQMRIRLAALNASAVPKMAQPSPPPPSPSTPIRFATNTDHASNPPETPPRSVPPTPTSVPATPPTPMATAAAPNLNRASPLHHSGSDLSMKSDTTVDTATRCAITTSKTLDCLTCLQPKQICIYIYIYISTYLFIPDPP